MADEKECDGNIQCDIKLNYIVLCAFERKQLLEEAVTNGYADIMFSLSMHCRLTCKRWMKF
jgi:hypothetical protein